MCLVRLVLGCWSVIFFSLFSREVIARHYQASTDTIGFNRREFSTSSDKRDSHRVLLLAPKTKTIRESFSSHVQGCIREKSNTGVGETLAQMVYSKIQNSIQLCDAWWQEQWCWALLMKGELWKLICSSRVYGWGGQRAGQSKGLKLCCIISLVREARTHVRFHLYWDIQVLSQKCQLGRPLKSDFLTQKVVRSSPIPS